MVDELGMEREPVAEISTPMEDRISRLKDLTAQATSRYSLKDYNAAAELYAHATELQAEINGEMSSDNSNLLYAYGRCLYHVAVNNSDVLGPRVAGEKPKEGPKKSPRKEALGYAEESGEKTNRSAGEATAGIDKENIGPIELQDVSKQANKPYFQFTGDENFDTSDEDAEDEETDGAEEDADEEDDFANAYEVLDMARILTHQKIKEVEVSNGKGKSKGDLPDIRHLQELLADTYDLQAEISLEGERFSNAATDLKSALELKYSIYPPESSILAEAHYKLALALEFSSVIQQRDENGDIDSGKEVQVDYQLREEAAVEMQEAIASCNARIRKERENLHDRSKANEDVALTKELAKDIQEVEEMVEEMGQRVNEHSISEHCCC